MISVSLTAAELGLHGLISQSQSRGDEQRGIGGGGGGSAGADASYTPPGMATVVSCTLLIHVQM